MTGMIDWVAYRAYYTPEAEAFIDREKRWTYAEFQCLVTGMAETLSSDGIQQGDHVGLLPQNSVRSAAAIAAVQRLGGVPVIFNSRWQAPEISRQLEAAQCRILFTDDPSGEATYFDARPLTSLASLNTTISAYSRFQTREIDLSAPCLVMFTSGSSGAGLGVELSYGNVFWSNFGSVIRSGNHFQDRWLACLPIFHIGGLSIIQRGLLNGVPVYLQNGFQPEEIYLTLEREQITLISLVPTMLHRLMNTDPARMEASNLRTILIGGGTLQTPLLEECLRRGLPISLTYGMTEAASQIATANPNQVLAKPGTVGKPLFFNKLAIQDETGVPLGPHAIGEITVEGPTVMRRYISPVGGEGKKLEDGKLYTGDLGYIDPDGDLWIIGRKDSVINSGGEKVFPLEIEETLLQHPHVQEAHVFGVADPEWGQRVSAAIVPTTPTQPQEAELIEFLKPKLGGYKIPRTIIFLDHLPRTGSGKIDHTAIRKQVEANNGSK